MRTSEPILDPVTNTVTISLAMYIHMTGGSYGNNGLADELDDFLMYTFKVKRCDKNRPHNWTDCPFSHRGEKAKRRDPQRYPYHGISCPDWRKNGECENGAKCEFAHGIFEYWLHPTRYRTRMCELLLQCPRKVCFFAHSPQQLRSVRNECYECVDEMMAYSDPFTVAFPAAAPSGSIASFLMKEPEQVVTKPVQCFACTNAARQRAARQSAVRAAMAAAATYSFVPRYYAGGSSQQYNMQSLFAPGPSTSSAAPWTGGAGTTAKGKEVMRTDDEYYDFPDVDWLKDLVN